MTKTELVHKWFEDLWEKGIESTIDEMLAPDMVAHGLAAGDLVGRDAFRSFYRAYRAAFPTVRVNVHHVLESGDYATSLVDVQVTAADGRGPLRLAGSSTVRVRDGQLVEGWNYFDFLTLLIGMGVVAPDVMETALTSARGRA
ncbi:MAG TPA: nuclear transport factor 2 family protein [Gemmatimonadaceae bacterium]|nr:nuclear transport factor 2 family protein [Gemmatimonadaceae bacterium]